MWPASSLSRGTCFRSGPRNLDSRISVISARRGDGIARWDGEEDDQEIQTQSRGGIQGQGRFGGGTGRQDALGASRAVRGAPDAGHAVEAAITRTRGRSL